MWKSRFILADRSDFYIIDNQSMAVHAIARRTLTSLSVDEILLLMNRTTNFRDLPLKVEMAPPCLKHMYSVYLRCCRDQCLPLLAVGYAARIRLGQGYFREAQDHLCSPCLS